MTPHAQRGAAAKDTMSAAPDSVPAFCRTRRSGIGHHVSLIAARTNNPFHVVGAFANLADPGSSRGMPKWHVTNAA